MLLGAEICRCRNFSIEDALYDLMSMHYKRSLCGLNAGTQPLLKRFSIPISLVTKSVICILIAALGLACGRQRAPAADKPKTQPRTTSAASPFTLSATPADAPALHSLLSLTDPTQGAGARPVASSSVIELRQQLQRDPSSAAVRVHLATLLSVRGQDSDAEDVLRAALKRGQHTAEIYHALGMLYLHNNQYAPAAQSFTVETSLHPKDFQAHLKLATAYAYLSRVDDANREFEAAKAIDPAVPDTYMGLAYLNNSSERYPYAVQYLNEYIKRSRQPGPGYALLSRVYLNMKLYEQAVTAGQTASIRMPDNAAIWYTLGQAYSYRPGDQYLSDGARAFEQAVKMSPHWGKAHFELGHSYARQNRVKDAIAQYREAIRDEPDKGKNHYQLGQLLMQQGQTEEGKRELQKAQTLIGVNQREDQLQQKIAAMPTDPGNLFKLAQLYKKMGSYSQAESWFQDTLVLAPHYPHAREQLAEVRHLLRTPVR